MFSLLITMFADAAREKMITPPADYWDIAGLGLSRKIKGFDPLPNVQRELEGIVDQGEQDDDGEIPGIIRLNSDFTNNAIQDALFDEYKVLHIASSFYLNPGGIAQSFLLLGDSSRLALSKYSCRKSPGYRKRGRGFWGTGFEKGCQYCDGNLIASI